MFGNIKRFLLAFFPTATIVLVLLLAATAHAGDFQDGLDAEKRKDYKTALAKFTPLAEKDDVMAQSELGWMYYRGLGTVKDYKAALKYLRYSAERGVAKARASKDPLEKKMTREQIAEAQELTKNWKPILPGQDK